MKKQFFHMAIVRRVVSNFIVTTFIVVAGFTAHAQQSVQKQEIKNATVIYNGTEDDQLSFTVKFDNTEGDKVNIILTDHRGNILYDGAFTDKKFFKTFQVARPDESQFTFTIRNTKTNEAQSFEVNTKLIEEVVVKKVG